MQKWTHNCIFPGNRCVYYSSSVEISAGSRLYMHLTCIPGKNPELGFHENHNNSFSQSWMHFLLIPRISLCTMGFVLGSLCKYTYLIWLANRNFQATRQTKHMSRCTNSIWRYQLLWTKIPLITKMGIHQVHFVATCLQLYSFYKAIKTNVASFHNLVLFHDCKEGSNTLQSHYSGPVI